MHRPVTGGQAGARAEKFSALFQQAVGQYQAGRGSAADELCAKVLRADPKHAGAWHLRGLLALEGGRTEVGIDWIEKSLRLQPNQPPAHSNIGNALLKNGQPERALARFERALALKPDYAVAHGNRGLALLHLSRLDEAIESFRRALALAPRLHDVRRHLALALNDTGNSRLEQGAAQEALTCYDESLALVPDRAETLYNRGAVLRELRRNVEAAQCFADAMRMEPDNPKLAVGNLFQARMDYCDWRDYDELVSRLQSELQRERRIINPLSTLLIDAPEVQLACAQGYVTEKFSAASRLAVEEGCVAAVGAGPAGRERIRIAYVSNDFREHPVGYLLAGVLEQHDRSAFEVIGVSLRPAENTALGARLRGACDRFIEAGTEDDAAVAARMRQLGADIAVDLMGFTQGMRLGIFAHRAAPVQAAWLGYAGTTGADFMDYLIADAMVIPPGAEPGYSEQVVRLPHCYLPNDDRRGIAPAPGRMEAGLPEQGFVFCAFTNAYKINPRVFDAWMRLLRETPGSVLWLRSMGAEAAGNLRREAAARDVAPERLLFAPHLEDMAAHLARLSLADLYLDTLPYNAHSTTCDALWAGVPVLTCPGQGFAARVASSALAAAGLPELIASGPEDYVRLGLELAREPARLRALRTRLLERRHETPLFDTAAFTRNLEQAFRTMHERAGQGLVAQGFEFAAAESVPRAP